jgi:deoxyribonuclease V
VPLALLRVRTPVNDETGLAGFEAVTPAPDVRRVPILSTRSSPARLRSQYASVPVWPRAREELIQEQSRLGVLEPTAWGSEPDAKVGGVFLCFARGESGPGGAGDAAWTGACIGRDTTVVPGQAGAPYEPGLLALREGALLEAAVRALPELPDVLLVDATGRDHPRRAGLALQLGAMLGLPTVGVTHRPLIAEGKWPADERGARSPLLHRGELVGYWLRTRVGTRPLAVHAAWRTDPDAAAEIVLSASRVRTPEPLRTARRRAREARALSNSDDRREGRERW